MDLSHNSPDEFKPGYVLCDALANNVIYFTDDQIETAWRVIAPYISPKKLVRHSWSKADFRPIIAAARRELSLQHYQ